MLLEVNVDKKYQGFSSRVDFSIAGDRCGVFGPSGSGKSTLMNMLAGLVNPDNGVIKLNGRTLFDSREKINVSVEKRKVGVVFQHAHLFPHMSVAQNLLYGMKRRKPGQPHIDPEQLVTVLHLENLLERRITRLSGGEKQRVALGRTILASPELILLDEPLTGLDHKLKYPIIRYLNKVFSEFSIPMLFISHSLQEMRMMTDEVLVMQEGRIENQLPAEELARSSLGTGGRGYMNLLQLDEPEDQGDLFHYRWGRTGLLLLKSADGGCGQFMLNGRDILLFKKHPEATSARNMLSCTVTGTYQAGWLVGVELDCQGNSLIAEIVPQSIEELGIWPGVELVAVIKASAFQKLH